MKPSAIEDSKYSTSTQYLTQTRRTVSIDTVVEADPAAICFARENTSLTYCPYLRKEMRIDSESGYSRRRLSINTLTCAAFMYAVVGWSLVLLLVIDCKNENNKRKNANKP